MRMQSVKWSRNTAASLAMAVMMGGSSALAIDGKTAGQDAGKSALSRFGSKNAINSNISLPMTNSSNLMQTVNGATSFPATLTAPSSAKFLEVFIQPSGTGDLQQVIVSQDLNTDGTIDNAHTVPALVSGVCANGFISCNAGSWSNCRYYTWAADADGRVSEAPASITDLGGCYCINSSCGSNLVWVNSAIVLKDIGGGIVNAVHTSNTSFTITSVNTDITTITYYGQVTSQTNNAASSVAAFASSPTVSTLTGYYTNWPQLTAARDSAATSQPSDPSSFYYLISNSGAARQAQGKASVCTVDRAGRVDTTVTSFNDSGPGQVCTDHLIYMRVHKVDDLTYRLQYLDTGPGGPGAAHNNCNDNPGGDGWHTYKSVAVSAPDPAKLGKLMSATFNINNMGGPGCSNASASVDGIINGFDTSVQVGMSCPAGGAQWPTFNWSYFFDYKEDQYTESVEDRCATLANDPDCRLKDEEIDSVVTNQNFNPTGLNQLPSCKPFTGQVGTNNICRDWWHKKRTYVCGSQQYDFSDVATRFGQVVSSASDNTANLTFQDPRLGPQGWSVANGSINLPQRDPATECEVACKTRIAKTDTQVTTTGNVTDMRVPAQSYDIFYKTCIDNSCPADPGEEIVIDCQCINEFAEAATVIQTLRLAGKDNICSSGQKQPMQSR
ncbi:hypothetical protein KI809_02460 [Geobacter pelophilus]|uniref:Uncharacterized protein n=2 Tax=Geoanaerobacter pelophilus TaxID=60036 RepID=A0AAW4KZ00_9BACT|nr:hypothetical protein [Geoanaerobacter pelophilus]